MDQPTSPKIPFPPPLIFVVGFGIGWLIAKRWSLELLSGNLRTIGVPLGWISILLGLAMMLTGLIIFARARTGIMPNHSAERLLTNGPYRLSRNPMYVGLTIAYAGGVLLTNIAWCLFILIVVLILFDKVIIPREEKYLAVEFGEPYLQYCKQVRRWL
jgi:protein-S-isoprenylcysteine O-methyltransferase Ste14